MNGRLIGACRSQSELGVGHVDNRMMHVSRIAGAEFSTSAPIDPGKNWWARSRRYIQRRHEQGSVRAAAF